MTDHQPIQQDKAHVMNVLASVLDDALNGEGQPRKWGFALLVYPFGESPHKDRMNYIGNGRREDVLVAIKELAARWEGRYQEPGTKQ